jgi:hypothetical protein
MLKNNTYRRYAFIVAFILSLLIINVGMVTANPNQKNLEKQSNVTHNSAIINNGVIQLGVNDEGDLNVGGGTPSSGTGTTIVGLRYMPTKADAISPGCPCEGWGVADKTTQISGWANRDYGGAHGMTLVSFTSDSTSATSIVKISNTLQVTHFYHPSASPNLYQVDVSIKNIGSTPAELLYRRTMDWDVEPTAFDEFVTVNTGTANNIIFTSDDGFAYSNPLSGPSDIGHTGSFTDAGPDDHGALFDFNFGTLSPGETKEFKLFYGAAADESEAKAALATIGAEAYSLGKPNTPDGKTLGKPNTFIFAATGVGGTPIISSGPIANAGPDIVTRSGDNVYFTGSATGNIVEYNWNFGDGDGSNQKDPVHRFRGSPYGDKTYTITLTVKDEIGNIGKDTAYVTVKPLEKNLEVSNDPVPPTTKVYAKIKPIYNWVSAEKGYDEYVVNRIEYEYGGGFTGDISISIVSEVCAACGAPELDWDTDILTINKDKVAGTYYVASEGNLGSSHSKV